MDLDLTKLQRECTTALREFIDAATMTCQLLEGVSNYPVSSETKFRLLDQRMKENELQERYQRARQKLFHGGQLGFLSRGDDCLRSSVGQEQWFLLADAGSTVC